MSALHTPIIKRAKELLEEDERVVAAWLEGSIARDEEDELSDIDLWVVIKDDAFEEWIEDRAQFAAQVGPVVSMLYPMELESSEDADQVDSFRILFEDQPMTLSMGVNAQVASREFVFTRNSAAEECLVLFDNADILKKKAFSQAKVERYAKEVFQDVTVRFWHRVPKIVAHTQRDDLLEAVHVYREALGDLLVLMRIMHQPEKIDFGWKHVAYDLPEDAIKVLRTLQPDVNAKRLLSQTRKMAKHFEKLSRRIAQGMEVRLNTALIAYIKEEL